ncbi:MAG: alpha/beta hydrolase [Betaproteobacteria bacterium]|nr:alpha/beta hydrolase [Betaproteobacteria bacterium]
MPTTRISPELEMHYVVDDYTDPWREAETILMLHGNTESGAVWFGWVPHLARRFRVVRPDMRGFGASTPMARDYPWTIEGLIDDYLVLLKQLGIARVHLVGAKLGGTIARCFAARCPEIVRTLTVVGTPPPRRDLSARVTAWTEEFEKLGVEHWARRTMTGRLGSRLPPEGVEWWIRMMGRTAVSTQIGYITRILTTDITAVLPRIVCPTLVITTEGSSLGSVAETRAWQEKMPNSELLVLPGDSFHVAASDPDRCAQATLDFILRSSPSPG